MCHALSEMANGIRGKVLLKAKNTVCIYDSPSLRKEVGEVGKDIYLEAIAACPNRYDEYLVKVNANVICYDRYGVPTRTHTRKMITGWILVDPDDVKYIE